jgi:hypothetical protein
MKVTPLWKAVQETKADIVKVESTKEIFVLFEKECPKMDWFIKGEYSMVEDIETMRRVLWCNKLEKDITITINHPTIVDFSVLDRSEVLNRIVSVTVFHKGSLVSSSKDIKFKDIGAFADACIKSYNDKNKISYTPEVEFAIFVVDWKEKLIKLQSI